MLMKGINIQFMSWSMKIFGTEACKSKEGENA